MSTPAQPHTVSLSSSGPNSKPKRSLVMAGGGMRVAYQAGVLQAMEEQGLTFDHMDGTSGGTMNLAMLFSGLTPREMCDRWRTLNVKNFVSLMPFEEYLQMPRVEAFGDPDGVRNKVFPHLGIDIPKIRVANGAEGTFNVCNFTDKTNDVIPHTEQTMEMLIAGISLPMLMPAVKYNGKTFVDSIWIKDDNVMEAVKRGAEEIWMIWCIGNHGVYMDGTLNQYVHMMELSANGALFEEFERIKEVNERIKNGESPYGQTQPIKLYIIKPEYPLPLDTDFFFNRVDASTLVSMGYADASRYLASYNHQGVELSPTATRMKDPKPGIAFREKMEGWFALEAETPEQGAKQGKENGTKLALHGSIYIYDLKRFMEDEDHSGTMAGHIEFEPFNDYLPAKTGVFNLFVEKGQNQPDTKWMIYEMQFDHDGKSYYLAGKKEVRDDPGFDIWEDTTTLHVTLHEGTDTAGKIVGAGVLKLSENELFKLLKTLHPINAEHSAEKFNLLANFGAFFMGELWDSYRKWAKDDEPKNGDSSESKGWKKYLKPAGIFVLSAGIAWILYKVITS